MIGFDLIHDSELFSHSVKVTKDDGTKDEKKKDTYKPSFRCVIIKKSLNVITAMERLIPKIEFESDAIPQENKVALENLVILHFGCSKYWVGSEIFCGFVTHQHKVGYFITDDKSSNKYYIAQDFFDFVYDSIKVVDRYIFAHCKSYSKPIENLLVFKRYSKDNQTQKNPGEVKELLYGSIRGLNETIYQIDYNDYDAYEDYQHAVPFEENKKTVLNPDVYVSFLDGVVLKKYKVGKLMIHLGGKSYAEVKQWKLVVDWIDNDKELQLSEIFMPKPYSTMGWIYILSSIFLTLIPLIFCYLFCYNREEKKKEKEFEKFRIENLDIFVMDKKVKKKSGDKEVGKKEKVDEKKVQKKKKKINLKQLFRKDLKDIDVDEDHGYLEIMEGGKE